MAGLPPDQQAAVAAAEALRVDEWCAAQGVERPSDLAFMFTHYDEALHEAGRAVADAWQLARSGSAAGLALGARRVMASIEPPPPRPSKSARLTSPKPSAKSVKAKAKGSHTWQVRVVKGASLPPSSYLSGADDKVGENQILAIMLGASSFRPSTDSERAAMQDFVGSVVSRAEPVTLRNALVTWGELRARSDQLQVQVQEMNAMQLAAFIREHPAPTRSYNSLFWMVKNLKLTFDLSLVVRPKKRAAPSRFGTGARQAPVLPPAGAAMVESLLESEKGHAKWSLLFAMHCMIFGVVRFQHIQRSTVHSVGDVILTFWCHKHTRQGFFWQVPRYTTQGVDLWETLRSNLDTYCTNTGVSLEALTVVAVDLDAMQPVGMQGFIHMLEDILAKPLDLSSYSLRRVGPTWAALVSLPDDRRLAMGNWVDKGQSATTPIRYSAARLHQAAQVKLCLLGAVATFSHHSAWTALSHVEAKTQYDADLLAADANLAASSTTVLAQTLPQTDDATLGLQPSYVKRLKKTAKKWGRSQAKSSDQPPAVAGPGDEPAEAPAAEDVVSLEARMASDEVFDALARARWQRPGHSNRPEPVSLVWRGADGVGNVWLGGLPRYDDLAFMLRENITLVLSAMRDRACDCEGGLPELESERLQEQVSISYNGQERQTCWDELRYLIPSTLHHGESIWIHCLAGVHRAPVLGGMAISLLIESSLEDSLHTIKQVRAIEPEKVRSRKGGDAIFDWARQQIARGFPNRQLPEDWVWKCSVRDRAAWRIVEVDNEEVPLCKWNQARDKAKFKGETFRVAKTKDAWYFGRPFCRTCRMQLPASLKRLCVERWFAWHGHLPWKKSGVSGDWE